LAVNLNHDKKEKNILFIVNLLASTKAVRDLTNVCFTDTGPNRGLTIYVRSCVSLLFSNNSDPVT
jgi:hypothetical protein